MGQSQITTNKINRQSIIVTLSVLTTTIYPFLFVYFRNADRSNFREVTGLLIFFFVNAILIYLISFLYFKNFIKAGLLTNTVMLITLLFGVFENVINNYLPMLFYWHILMILSTLMLIFARFIKTKLSTEIVWNICIILFFVFSSLIVFNGVTAAPEIIKKNVESTSVTQAHVQIGSASNNSNVYYLLFDEYGGYDNLLRYTGYDNSPFYHSLEDLGFNVSKHSRNYTTDTFIEVPNLLNLALVNTPDMSYETMKEALQNPYLFRLFKENGYQLNIVSDYGFVPVETSDIEFDYALETEAYEDTIENIIKQNSVYYPFLLNQSRNNRIVQVERMFQYVSDSWQIQSENLFTFAYLWVPHHPWVVDEFGNNISLSEKANWQNSDTYLGQLKYSSKMILDVVQTIIKNDPEAIIILQSDHGYRQPIYLHYWYDVNYDDVELEKFHIMNILNAVYFRGEILNINSKSGINTLLEVINNHFGLNYPLLEQDGNYETH